MAQRPGTAFSIIICLGTLRFWYKLVQKTHGNQKQQKRPNLQKMVGLAGFEPTTFTRQRLAAPTVSL